MGYNGTAYVRLWDMPARTSLSLTFFDFPFNESFCFFEVGGRCHLGCPNPAHLGTASSAPNLIKTHRPQPSPTLAPTPQTPRPDLCGPPASSSRALEVAVSLGNTNRSGPNLR